jgi:hypothetical protein
LIWLLAAPVVLVGIKGYVASSISEAIVEGTYFAKNQTIKELYKLFIKSFITISINLIFLLIAVYGFPYLVNKNTSIIIISLVYLSSILQGILNVKRKISTIKIMVTKYKLNIKKYIQDQIYEEAYYEASKKIRNLGFFSRKMNDWFGESAHSIARKISESAIERVFREAGKGFFRLFIILISYYLIARLIVTPFLINSSTSMSTIEVVTYPLIFSLNFLFDFFGINII